MRCLLPLIALLGAAHAAPFFKFHFGPEHRADLEGGAELPAEPLPQEVPEDAGAVFALQLPKIDLSDLFRPFRVFAGVNVNHPTVIAVRPEEPNCDVGKFDLTDEEFDVVMDCQKMVGSDEVELKECILTTLPKTTVELRGFLDREEFGVAGLSSSFNLALIDGEFTQQRSVQFRLCPLDEVNSIDGGDEVVPVVEEMVPIELLSPDRVGQTESEFSVIAPETVVPPHRPLFQFPQLKLPDFGQIFTQAFAPVFGPPPQGPPQGQESGLGLFGSSLNPFAVRQPPAVAGPQQGFFASLFPALAATPPPQVPDGIDTSDCASKKFGVSRFVYNVANRCQYANDYRKCLEMDLADDESATDLLEFALDPNYSVVASSFSSFQATFDLAALHSGKGLLDMSRTNQIDLRRCANIVKVAETTEAATEEASEPAPGATEAAVLEVAPEEVPTLLEEASEPALEVTEGASAVLEAAPEEVPTLLEEYPEQPAPGAEVTAEVAPEEPKVFEPTLEAPVEPAVDAEKTAVEAKKVIVEAEATAEAEKATVEAEKATVEAEKAPVETEKAPVEADKATVEADKATVEAEKATVATVEAVEAEKATVEAEKATVEAEKATVEAVEAEKATVEAVEAVEAAAGVESPAKESKPVESKDIAQTVYDVAEP